MQTVVDIVGYVNLVAFALLGLIAVYQWRARRDPASLWAALTFGAIGAVVVLGRFIPEHPSGTGEQALQNVTVAVLVLFPYLLFRFAGAFAGLSRRVRAAATAVTAALVVWSLALPDLPEAGEPRPAWFWLYLVLLLTDWAVLSALVAWRLWQGGRGQPSVARRRMKLLAVAAATLALALVLAGAQTAEDSPLALATGLLAFASAVAFLLGLAPPRFVRWVWRQPEENRVREAIGSLMQSAAGEEEVAARVLTPVADIVGARAVVLHAPDGQLLGSSGPHATLEPEDAVGVSLPDGSSLLVWTSRYAPFFGGEELKLLRTLGALTGLALDRSRLFARERDLRLALEEADEAKSRFVALAAHELRNPVSVVKGIADTIHDLRDRLDGSQRRELEDALHSQAGRLATLVEQLLDLSRLDAHALEIEPVHLPLRERAADLVAAVAPDQAVDLRIPAGLTATVDPNVFDRVVSNLLVNALRYGEPPIAISARSSGGRLQVSVEDRGPGVPPELVAGLFERFTRGGDTRERVVGTGLGLAIARSYAHAHGGDLVYAPAAPHGARFELQLPAEPANTAVT